VIILCQRRYQRIQTILINTFPWQWEWSKHVRISKKYALTTTLPPSYPTSFQQCLWDSRIFATLTSSLWVHIQLKDLRLELRKFSSLTSIVGILISSLSVHETVRSRYGFDLEPILSWPQRKTNYTIQDNTYTPIFLFVAQWLYPTSTSPEGLVVEVESLQILSFPFVFVFSSTNVCLPLMLTFIGRTSTGYLNQSSRRLWLWVVDADADVLCVGDGWWVMADGTEIIFIFTLRLGLCVVFQARARFRAKLAWQVACQLANFSPPCQLGSDTKLIQEA